MNTSQYSVASYSSDVSSFIIGHRYNNNDINQEALHMLLDNSCQTLLMNILQVTL
jgi:hypothetical protein